MSNEGTPKAPLDALQKIKDAEEKAKALVQNAREAEAVNVMQAAQEEARILIQNLLEEARASASQNRQKIVDAAKGEAEKINQDSAEAANALREKAFPLMEKAVKKTALRIHEHLLQRKI